MVFLYVHIIIILPRIYTNEPNQFLINLMELFSMAIIASLN